jgi:hypothetical protein
MYSYGLRARFFIWPPYGPPGGRQSASINNLSRPAGVAANSSIGAAVVVGLFPTSKKIMAASSTLTDYIFMTFVQAHLRRKDQ